MKSVHDIPIFFIVSKGRSGSTLLVNLLDAHPSTIVPLESTFLIHLYSKYKYIKHWNEDVVNQYLIDLYRMRKIRKHWKLNRNELRLKLYEHLNSEKNVTYSSVSKIVYTSFESIFPKKDIQLIGDKNPIYSFSIKKIKEIYPTAKFIHLIRDPRANIRSHILAFKNRFISFIAFKWYYYNQEIEKRKQEDLSNTILSIRYEDLIENPEQSMKNICSFLGISFNLESLNFHKIIEAKYGKYEKYQNGTHANLTKPINKNLGEKWKSFFNKKQQNIINIICKKYLIKYQYEFQVFPITPINKLEIFLGKLYYKFWIYCLQSFYNAPFIVKKAVFKIVQIIFG